MYMMPAFKDTVGMEPGYTDAVGMEPGYTDMYAWSLALQIGMEPAFVFSVLVPTVDVKIDKYMIIF